VIARALTAAALVASVAAAGLALRRRARPHREAGRLDPDRLPDGVEPPAVLAFTSPLCLACEQTPGRVAEALEVTEAELRAGEAPIAFAEADVRERSDLAEALDVRRTPTVAGIAPEGRVRFVEEGAAEAGGLADRVADLEEG
jgi:hypothetical protein